MAEIRPKSRLISVEAVTVEQKENAALMLEELGGGDMAIEYREAWQPSYGIHIYESLENTAFHRLVVLLNPPKLALIGKKDQIIGTGLAAGSTRFVEFHGRVAHVLVESVKPASRTKDVPGTWVIVMKIFRLDSEVLLENRV